MVQSIVDRAVGAALAGLAGPGARALVAVSGGVDSVVLAHAMAGQGAALALGHVNHGLRGAESEADEAFVRSLGERLGLPVLARRADPTALRAGRCSRDRPTLQEAARTLRYDALAELAREAGASVIATAHNADDQAETLLLRLLRGTGPDGLGGIPERSPDGRILRPLLGVSRREIEAYARGAGVVWREDGSNQADAYARNRLRRHWLPGLAEEFNPRLLRSLGELAEALRRDAEWIEGQVAHEASERFHAEDGWLRIEGKDWDALPEALARRLARLALRQVGRGRDVSRAHLRRMLRFLREGRSGTAIELPGGLELAREQEYFRLSPSRVFPRGGC
jgi:tRNA(Ile)-lysidine synthase